MLVSVPEIKASPVRVEDRVKKVPDGAGGLVDQASTFPVWFDPKTSDGTPICEAFRKAAEVLASWT
jgi:hypothetical protein